MARARAFFRLSPHLYPSLSETIFAYVEWFTELKHPHDINRMYEVKRSMESNGQCSAAVIPVTQIYRSCHLIPYLKEDLVTALDPDTVLDTCDSFFLNDFLDLHSYTIL